ncbi:MAG: HAMP domain-containing protein [Sphaerochaetaceae bacterium]|nr:HAMP domain-containing protein [Sphaerochaetaceae bacterium]
MSVKKKILIGYGISLFFMVVMFVWAILNIIALRDATDAILSENYRSILAAKDMITLIELQDEEILSLQLNSDNRQSIQHTQRAYDAQFLQWLSKAKDNVTIEGEEGLVDRIETAYMEYRNEITRIGFADMVTTQDLQALRELSQEIGVLCNQLYRLNETVMYTARDNATALSQRAVVSTSLIALLTIILVMIFSFLLAERLVKPLRDFTEASRKISGGDYSVQVPVQTSDEIGLLAGEFNQMARKLQTFNEINIEQLIAEKRKSDAILSSIEDGLIVLNTDLEITGINPAAKSMFHLEFGDYTLLKCTDILRDEKLCRTVQEVIDSGRKPMISEEDCVLSVNDGDSWLHYLYSITNFRGLDGTVSGIVLLLRDVTHLKEIEQLKSEFIMTASHELRTPLTSLEMSLELMQTHLDSSSREQLRDLLGVANEEVARMKTLVHELLDLSKLETKSIQLEYERVSIKTIFTSIQRIFFSQLEIKQIAMTQLIPPSLEDIEVDVNKITWVLSNLVSNALRYVPSGGQIMLEAHSDESNIHISVKDNGPGIPVEFQSKIFEKFVQMPDSQKSGSGLGLAICKEIIRAHGGTIWVESQVGHGSAFIFLIPMKRWS